MLVVMQKRALPKREVFKMQPVNEYDFYELATVIHPLTIVPNGAKYSEIWYEWWSARNMLNSTFAYRRPLSVARPAANKLYDAMTQVVPVDFNEAAKAVVTDPDLIDPEIGYLGYGVREAAKEFEIVLRAELQSMDTYFVSQKGSHKTSDLILRARIAIPDSMREMMTEQAQLDFDQGGKCLVLDIPTAAGFHLLRSTESVLRQYYRTVTQKEPKPQMRNWGAYIKNLRMAGAETKVTDILEHIRITYRNPVQHPEENLTEEQAQVLFGVCTSAITLMISEIKRLSVQTPALQFPASKALTVGASRSDAVEEVVPVSSVSEVIPLATSDATKTAS